VFALLINAMTDELSSYGTNAYIDYYISYLNTLIIDLDE